jgi:ubiquitin-protein ligase
MDMISFRCPSCQKQFSVPDHYAGREARCACKQLLKVPQVAASTTSGVSLRQRRLMSDQAAMLAMFSPGKPIRVVESVGTPAERYVVEFDLQTMINEATQQDTGHRAEIELTNDYPRVGPRCRMLTTAFHPNIDASSICIGDHWAAGERLTDLVIRIGEMLTYQAYNIRSPLNAEAAMWADLNASRLPIDGRDLRALVS